MSHHCPAARLTIAILSTSVLKDGARGRAKARHRLIASACLLLALLAACGQPIITPEPIRPVGIRAVGSTTHNPLLTDLATAFSEHTPAISLEVTGGGTQFGLEALRAGEADLALASWLPAEIDPDWQAIAIARDGIAIVVHPTNPINGLGLLQLQDLFSGLAYEWMAVGGQPVPGAGSVAQPVSREAGSGTRAAFETLVMEDRPVSPRAIVVTSSQAVVDYVASHPQAIGYVSTGYLSPAVKALAVEGEDPAPEAVQKSSYPLCRELWLVTGDPPLPAVRQFIDFILSPAGQEIVGQTYVRIDAASSGERNATDKAFRCACRICPGVRPAAGAATRYS
jgi:phosphate transport system substrate-binding protein